LLAQFHPLEEALAAMGVVVWPMIELEADDALASAAHLASKDKKVQKVAIWTPDKDLAQCVRGTRVVQIDGRRKIIRDAAGVRGKFGVDPPLIPDLLALVGDAADGYPGIPGVGTRTAATLLNRYGSIEKFPPNILGEQRDLALLFKNLATLRTDAPLFKKVETLRWRGPTPAFAAWADRMKAPRLLERCDRVKLRHMASIGEVR
jgi:5'-3' exonuclease